MAEQEIAVVLRLLASQFQSELKKSGGLMGEFGKVLSDWRVQATAIGTTLFAIAKSTANFGEEALKAAQKTNSTVEAITALRHSANLADVPFETMINAMGRLSRSAFDAASGSKESQRAFQLLGIEVRTAENQMRPTEELLLELADRIKQTGLRGQEAAALNAIFSKSYQELVPWLIQGKDAMQAQMEEAKRLGIVMSEDDAKAANQFNDELKRLQASARGLTNQLGIELIPALTRLIEVMVSLASGPAGEGLGFILKVISSHLIGVNALVQELAANWEALKKVWSSDQGITDILFELKAKIEEIEARAKNQLFLLEHPRAAPLLAPEATTREVRIGGPGPVIEPEEGLPGRSRVNLDVLTAQIELSRRLAESKERLLQFEINLGAQAKQQLADNVQLAQAQLQAAEASGAGIEELARRRRAVLEAQQAQELASTELTETQRLAIVTKYTAQIDEQRRLETGGFLEGWRIGLNRYISDYGNMLGLAVDLSRRTAQLMEQAFRQFFFDLMENRIKSFKDLLRSLVDFVKQIVAQIAAQLVTIGILRLLTGAAATPAGYGTPTGPGLQHGGRFMVTGPGGTDSQLVRFMATPGERVTVETPEQQERADRGMGFLFSPSITIQSEINIHNEAGAQVEARRPRVEGDRIIHDFVIKTVRETFQRGGLDRTMQTSFQLRRIGGAR